MCRCFLLLPPCVGDAAAVGAKFAANGMGPLTQSKPVRAPFVAAPAPLIVTGDRLGGLVQQRVPKCEWHEPGLKPSRPIIPIKRLADPRRMQIEQSRCTRPVTFIKQRYDTPNAFGGPEDLVGRFGLAIGQ